MLVNQRTWFGLASLGLALIVLPGCGGDDSGRIPVNGAVTFNSTPVEEGAIVFIPMDNSTGSKTVIPIKDGRYSVVANKGPAPGKHRVEIIWNKKTGRQLPSNDPPHKVEEVVQVIPKKYNAQSTLTVEVQRSATNFDFDLKSQ